MFKKEVILFVVLLFGFVFWQFYISRFEYSEASVLHKSAPVFQAQNVRTGENWDLASFKGKKSVLINIWATWCDTCRLEIDVLNELYRSQDTQHVEFVSLLEDATHDIAQAKVLLENYHKKLPVDFPVYWDGQQAVADLYGTFRIPESFVISKEGLVVYRHEGAITKSDVPKIIEALSR